jgi:two-component system, chemotaxis family, chemotaxis protein CheY
MSGTKPWVGKGVVIVDDSANVCAELKQVFEACGMQVKGMAYDGVKGLELIQQHSPELVSLDIIMPEMDGVECYRKIQELSPETKVIIVSWLAGEAKILDNLRATMPAHIFQKKPVTAAELEARLQKVYFPERDRINLKPSSPSSSSLPSEPEITTDFLSDLGIKAS